MIKRLVIYGVCCLMLVGTTLAWAQSEKFTVSGEIIFPKTGDIHVQLITEEQFIRDMEDDDHPKEEEDNSSSQIDDDHVAKQILKVGEKELEQKKVSFVFENIPPGIYTIQSFQDVNGNGDLDEGMFGPKEPWGILNFKRAMFKMPKFDNIKFELKQDITDIKIEIK